MFYWESGCSRVFLSNHFTQAEEPVVTAALSSELIQTFLIKKSTLGV